MTAAPRYRLLVFDWDGTVEDSATSIARNIARVLRAIGKEPPVEARLKAIIGLNLTEGLAALYPNEDAGALARRCALAAKTVSGRESERPVLFDGALDTLSGLKAHGFWLAVATGKNRAGLDSTITQYRLGEHFMTTRCADDARSKPHPEMLLSILDELGVFAHEALMIGDTTFDMQMAVAAGVDALAVTYGVHSLVTLQAGGHTGPWVDDIKSLIPLLTKTAIHQNARF